MDRTKYLGQIIDQKDRKPDPERMKVIKKHTLTGQRNEAKSISRFRKLLLYMHSENVWAKSSFEWTTKKSKKWCWTKECEKALQEIKICLLSDLALAHFVLKKELIVASDASDYGIGAVLLYRLEDE